MGWDWFFDDYETDPKQAKITDQICNSCPVQRVCFEEGTATKSEGVWGGVYLNTQGKPDMARNNHKTAADWRALEKKLGVRLMRRGKSGE